MPYSPLTRAVVRFLALFLLLASTYGLWLATFWPGVLGEDSVAILLEAHNPDAFRSGKTVVWYGFVKLLYGTTARVEAPIAAAMLICALMLTRMLAWYWEQSLRKTLLFALAAIALAPHMIYFMGTLYPDGLFAIATVTLLFEIWLCTKRRQASAASLIMLALALPFAAFVRPNGLIFLLPAALAAFWIEARSRTWWLLITGMWCVVGFISTQFHRSTTQETQFPLAAFETAGFLQKRAMNELWKQYPHMNDPWVLQDPKVSPATIDALSRQSSPERIQQYRDPAYWDMLVFHPDGPQIGHLSPEDKHTIVHEFWTYNLWQNLPDFAASRVNVFLSAALAQGGFPALSYASNVLPRVPSESSYRRFHWDRAESWAQKVHAKSYAWRWALWTPWLGLALLLWATSWGVRHKDKSILLITIPMVVQLGGVFMFSIAGEYRYLLPFFVLPMVLLPAMATRNRDIPAKHLARAGHTQPCSQ